MAGKPKAETKEIETRAANKGAMRGVPAPAKAVANAAAAKPAPGKRSQGKTSR